jgi:uncharacterized protein (TIGR01244 family)
MRTTLAALLLLASCSTPAGDEDAPFTGQPIEPRQLEGLPSLVAVGPRVLIAGQPTPQGFAEARRDGVTLVINLRPEGEQQFDERTVVEGLGLDYANLPVTSATLDDARVEAFLHQMHALRRRPGTGDRVLLHCSTGNRVAALWAMYEIREGRLPVEEAVARARQAGLKSPELVQFIGEWARRQPAP